MPHTANRSHTWTKALHMVSCPSWDGKACKELPMARYMDVKSTLSASSAVKATAQARIVFRRVHTEILDLRITTMVKDLHSLDKGDQDLRSHSAK